MRKPSTFTAGRLRKLIAHIKAAPHTYDQDHFCGGACCLAGHALLMFGNKQDREWITGTLYISGVGARAETLLHLEHGPVWCHPLFDGLESWPARFRTRKPHKVTPHLAGKRVEHFIKTGRLD